jgi:hypothetical protein
MLNYPIKIFRKNYFYKFKNFLLHYLKIPFPIIESEDLEACLKEMKKIVYGIDYFLKQS